MSLFEDDKSIEAISEDWDRVKAARDKGEITEEQFIKLQQNAYASFARYNATQSKDWYKIAAIVLIIAAFISQGFIPLWGPMAFILILVWGAYDYFTAESEVEKAVEQGKFYHYLPKEFKVAIAHDIPQFVPPKEMARLRKEGWFNDKGYEPPAEPAKADELHPDKQTVKPGDRARLAVAGDRIHGVVDDYQAQQQQLGQSVGQRLADIPRNFAQGVAASIPVQQYAQPQVTEQQQMGELYDSQQMEDLVQILVDSAQKYIRSTVILGPSRAGKGVIGAYTSKQRKQKLGTVEWVIGAKRDPKESGYWSHCDRVEIFNFLTMNQFDIDQAYTRWIDVLNEFKRLDAPNGKVLTIDEASMIMKTSKKGNKDSVRQRFYEECNLYTAALSSMGASAKSGLCMIAPTSYVGELGITRGELNTFVPAVIMHVEDWDLQFLAGSEFNNLIPKDSGADQARMMAQQIGCKRIAWYRDRWVFLPEYPQIQPVEYAPPEQAKPAYTVINQAPSASNSYAPAQSTTIQQPQEDVEAYRPDWWGDKSRRQVQWQAADSLAKAGLSRSDIVKKMMDFKSEKYRGFAAALVELENEFEKLSNQ